MKKILFILYCFTSITAFCDDATRIMVYEQLQKLSPLKLYNGNVELIGEDQLARQELAQWVKLTLTKVKTLFGTPLKFENHTIRVVIKSETSEDKPFVTTSIFEGKILQRLVIPDVNNFDLELVELLFSEILIKGYIYDALSKAQLLNSYKNIAIPYWFKMGTVRSFYSSYREQDSEQSYFAWINGEIPPLREIFEKNLWSSYISGIFLSSIRKQANYRDHFNKIFTAISNDFEMNYFWFQQNIFNVQDDDFLLWWDNSLYIQKHMIYSPRKQLNDFERYLLQQSLYTFQGYSGVPNQKNLPLAVSPIMIIQHQDELWVDNYINSKTRQLQVSAAGKSEEYRKITNKICEYIVNIQSNRKVKEQIKQYREIQHSIFQALENIDDGITITE